MYPIILAIDKKLFTNLIVLRKILIFKYGLCNNPGNTYSVIYSTFRNIDALVEDKALGVDNGEHQHRAVESQNENNPSPFHPFSHQEQHHNETLGSPSRDHHQLPPPLNPIETRVTR